MSTLALCGGAGCAPSSPKARNEGVSGLRVAVAIGPLEELVQRVGGQYVTVTNLTQPGVEPHDAELTGDQIEELLTSDLVVYLSRGFQPAIEAALSNRTGAAVDALSLGPARRGQDPHMWLDPILLGQLGSVVATQLSRLDAKHADDFVLNAASWNADMQALDRQFVAGLKSCARRDVVTVHGAFAYLAARYRLNPISLSGASPDAEPTADQMATVSDFIRRHKVTTVFTEELVSTKVAEALARDTNTKTAVLSPIESFSKSEIAAGTTYTDKMRMNLSTLRKALDCS
jgi:zinc transport system substrate-binding protein